MHPEQQAFEDNIDREPTDATNHLVYADWLDEHDQPQEAAFRRAMGNWHGTGDSISPNEGHDIGHSNVRVHYRNLPEGIKGENIPFSTGIEPLRREYAHIPQFFSVGGFFRWPNRQAMEKTFRRQLAGNFFTSDTAEIATQNSRVLSLRRKSYKRK